AHPAGAVRCVLGGGLPAGQAVKPARPLAAGTTPAAVRGGFALLGMCLLHRHPSVPRPVGPAPLTHPAAAAHPVGGFLAGATRRAGVAARVAPAVRLAAGLRLGVEAVRPAGQNPVRTRTDMPRLYEYVGPDEIRRRALPGPAGVRIESPLDLENWV